MVTFFFFFFFFFLNGEFLSFQFSEKISLPNPRRSANLEKPDLIRRTTYQLCLFDSLDTCFGVSIRKTKVIRNLE